MPVFPGMNRLAEDRYLAEPVEGLTPNGSMRTLAVTFWKNSRAPREKYVAETRRRCSRAQTLRLGDKDVDGYEEIVGDSHDRRRVRVRSPFARHLPELLRNESPAPCVTSDVTRNASSRGRTAISCRGRNFCRCCSNDQIAEQCSSPQTTVQKCGASSPPCDEGFARRASWSETVGTRRHPPPPLSQFGVTN